ncbi:MAG: LysR family transcriptional regulator [Staphylococcus sp.]|jgi:transcriptional regulator, lysR family|nr:LysR family transcriptional regulator [Staphylococcus sp.]
MIDLKIKTLLTVAEEKNFTKAANKLNLTQPAVSHQIKELEDELQEQLFIRKKGDIIPTPIGDIVLNYARKFVAMHNKMIDDIKHNHKINIKLGITHTAESNKITEIIGSYLINNPGISVTIITDTTNNLYKMVENYELDLAIVDNKKNIKLNYLPLDTDYLVCVVNNNSPLAKKKIVTLKELKKENLILRLDSSYTRKLFESTLESINESINSFKVILELDNIETIKDLIRKDIGVSILAKNTCMDEVNRKKLTILPIENLSMIRKNYIIYTDYFNYIHNVKELVNHYNKEMNIKIDNV